MKTDNIYLSPIVAIKAVLSQKCVIAASGPSEYTGVYNENIVEGEGIDF